MTAFTPARSFGEVLDRPGAFVREHFKLLMGVAVSGNLVAVVPSSIGTVAQLLVDVVEPEMLTVLLIAGYAGAFVGIVVQLVMVLAVYEAVRALLAGQPAGVLQSYKAVFGTGRLPTVVLGWFASLLGLCACVVPGLVISVIMALVAPIVTHEPQRYLAAYRRAVRVLRYRPPDTPVSRSTGFRVVALLVLGWVLNAALTAIAWAPMVGVSSYLGFRAASQGVPALIEFEKAIQLMAVVTSVLQAVLGAIAVVYILTCFTLLFLSAREQMEGRAIERALAERGFPLPEDERLLDAGAAP